MQVDVSFTLRGETSDGEFLDALEAITRVVRGEPVEAMPTITTVEAGEDFGDDDIEDVEEGDEAGEGGYVPGGWNAKRADRFVRLLTTDARKAVAYMVEHAPECEVGDVIDHLGLSSGLQLGGRLSSVGHAMNNMPNGMVAPFERQYGTYYLDKRVAKIINEAMTRYKERHSL